MGNYISGYKYKKKKGSIKALTKMRKLKFSKYGFTYL